MYLHIRITTSLVLRLALTSSGLKMVKSLSIGITYKQQPGPNPNGHTMTDGTTTITDLDKTEANRTLVRNFVDYIFVNGKMERLASYFNGDNYIQHNPQIPSTNFPD